MQIMLGLMPTQRDEWRRKHMIRFFFEERICEFLYVLNRFIGIFLWVVDINVMAAVTVKKIVVSNKHYGLLALVALALVIALIL